MANGANCLETLHRSNYMKKVNTNQVIITPNAKSSVRLDELNNILNEMDKGEAAIKKLADLDANAGMSGKRREPREVGAPLNSRSQAAEVGPTALADVLTDDQLAAQRVAQAAKMKLDAHALLAEAARLEGEATTLTPTTKNATTTKKAGRTKKQTA